MKRISTQLYNSCDVSVSDFLSDKQNKVHMMLFNDALSKCIAEKNLNRDEYAFYEIDGKQAYYEPVYVLIVSRNYPFTKEKVDLSKWWLDYKFNTTKKPFDAVTDDIEFSEGYYEIEYKDYIKGKYRMASKFYEEPIKADFNSLKEKRTSEDMSLETSFQNRVRNKIYG